ncbi:chondroadherin-like protein [Microplitis mediator]|uniref:chondroadherin-like protein n=1 Tax=Microplitis mediator TaxID=375433 RepID=UPI0025554B53|nr:chondroadherin-like protein [Microplitis mediator]
MSGLLYTLLGLAASASLHCAVRREISPCTCRQEKYSPPAGVVTSSSSVSESPTIIPGGVAILTSLPTRTAGDGGGGGGGGGGGVIGDSGIGGSGGITKPPKYGEKISVMCEKMESFGQVADALRGKFTPGQQIILKISHSQLKDISRHDFKELQMSISRLELNHDHLSTVDGEVFAGLSRTMYLNLADNEIPSIPRHILSHLPLLITLELSRNRITRIDVNDFKYNPSLQQLLLAGNPITEMIPGSLPPRINKLHVGRNHLRTLNRTLCDLNQLEWLFINSNELTSLDGELPTSGHNLRMLHAMDNKLTHLPPEFRQLHRLEMLFLQHNKIRSLDGTLQKASNLKYLELSYNELQELTAEDFVEAELLEDLELGHNSLKSLGGDTNGNGDGNGSKSALWPLRSLKCLNLTHNELSEFSFVSLRGLKELRLIDLSSNQIARVFRGPIENLVDEDGEEIPGASIQELRLQNNKLQTLEDSLFVGMRELQRLNLSHNALGPTIGSQKFRGLENLRNLDLSHNKLTTLEDISEARLPALEELIASHNRLVTLSDRDFRGFPILCSADLTMNEIRSLTAELVANTRCTVHGVPDILRIYLQDNPVLCDAALVDLTVALEVNHAKVYGTAKQCPAVESPATEATSFVPIQPSSDLFYAPAVAAADTSANISFAATLEQ